LKKAVIFDMDGVLIDSEPIYIQSNREYFKELGLDISMERHLTYVGICARKMWHEIRDTFGLQESVEELLNKEKETLYKLVSEMNSLPTIPGIYKLLSELQKKQIKMAVASSSPRAMIDLVLRKLEMENYFEAIVCGDDISNGKPAPDIFLQAAERINTAPGECVVIEDSTHGVAGALDAGMTCVGFANPNSGNQDLSRADTILSDFSAESIHRILLLLH
jgi:beta-phosphoglucomutase family hydrolase